MEAAMLRADPTEFLLPASPARVPLYKRAAIGLAAVWKAWVNRRRLMPLLELDDHMLRDIGVTRHDVAAALSLPAAEDPSPRLVALSRERQAARRARAAERLVGGRYY
jgi:uncharacterized protein YjiS (DUF1127 family)